MGRTITDGRGSGAAEPDLASRRVADLPHRVAAALDGAGPCDLAGRRDVARAGHLTGGRCLAGARGREALARARVEVEVAQEIRSEAAHEVEPALRCAGHRVESALRRAGDG